MLGHFVASASDDEGRASGDVEAVLAVATRADDVECVVFGEVHVLARLEQSLTEAEQLVNGHAARLQCHQQGGNLLDVILFLHDVEHDFVGVFLCEGVALDEL